MRFSAIHLPSLCGSHFRWERTANAVRDGGGRPLVHSTQSSASLVAFGLADLEASLASQGLLGLLAPFRPERIAQPG